MPIIKDLKNAGRVLTGQAPRCSICGSMMVKDALESDTGIKMWRCPKCSSKDKKNRVPEAQNSENEE